ncbi:hypothetical protein EBB07_27630 [Paenibacillaceae bacterium]|nr:hypothetical protein EBB07_27630 [Paenibacillaceae bacterium]
MNVQPYGVLVRSEEKADYQKDSWVKIVGIIARTVYNGNEVMELQVQSVQEIPPSDTPYLYPYYDDFIKLAEAGR